MPAATTDERGHARAGPQLEHHRPAGVDAVATRPRGPGCRSVVPGTTVRPNTPTRNRAKVANMSSAPHGPPPAKSPNTPSRSAALAGEVHGVPVCRAWKTNTGAHGSQTKAPTIMARSARPPSPVRQARQASQAPVSQHQIEAPVVGVQHGGGDRPEGHQPAPVGILQGPAQGQEAQHRPEDHERVHARRGGVVDGEGAADGQEERHPGHRPAAEPPARDPEERQGDDRDQRPTGPAPRRRSARTRAIQTCSST